MKGIVAPLCVNVPADMADHCIKKEPMVDCALARKVKNRDSGQLVNQNKDSR
jgi:hypothetical protein